MPFIMHWCCSKVSALTRRRAFVILFVAFVEYLFRIVHQTDRCTWRQLPVTGTTQCKDLWEYSRSSMPLWLHYSYIPYSTFVSIGAWYSQHRYFCWNKAPVQYIYPIWNQRWTQYPIWRISWYIWWHQSGIHIEILWYRNWCKLMTSIIHHITLKREFGDEKPKMSYPNMEFILVLYYQFGKTSWTIRNNLGPNWYFLKTMNAEKLFDDVFCLSN
jgi:hypothetical protein